jgi:hypothetical protein
MHLPDGARAEQYYGGFHLRPLRYVTPYGRTLCPSRRQPIFTGVMIRGAIACGPKEAP